MTQDPLVTVVMASYNAGEYLRPAVESILCQSFVDFELILVDDGSTDDSVADLERVCRDDRLRIICQANAGKPASVNRAIDVARGRWVAIQDADDLASPKRLELLVERVNREPELGAVFSGYDLLVGRRRLAPIMREKDVFACKSDIAQFIMPSHDPTIMFRRDLGLRLRYDEDLRIGEGHDFILRLGEVTPMAVVAENLYSYRVAWNSLTRSEPRVRQSYVARVMKKACDRRGADFASLFPTLAEEDNAPILADNGIHTHFIESVMSARERRDWKTAWGAAVQSIFFQPLSARYYRPVAYAILPLIVIDHFRGRRS